MKGTYYTMKEVKKLIIIQSVIDGKRNGKESSQILNLSERQIWRLVKKVKEKGNDGIKNGNCNRIVKNKISEETINKVINLKKSYEYEVANFKHFKELIEERDNIKLSYTSIYNILKNNDFISKNKHKDRIVHRRRKRKSQEGEFVQVDGTPFDWFENGIKYSIHGFIDDATGKILGLYMMKNECLLGYLEALRYLLKNFGIPKVLYPDKYSVFFPTCKQKLTVDEQLKGKKIPTTQFMNIITTLGMNMYPASTSQAKGRIERLWKTLEQANIFFKTYIPKYNTQFAIKPELEKSCFSKVPDFINLDFLLSIKI